MFSTNPFVMNWNGIGSPFEDNISDMEQSNQIHLHFFHIFSELLNVLCLIDL